MTRTVVLEAIALLVVIAINIGLAAGNFVLRRKLTAALREVSTWPRKQ